MLKSIANRISFINKKNTAKTNSKTDRKQILRIIFLTKGADHCSYWRVCVCVFWCWWWGGGGGLALLVSVTVLVVSNGIKWRVVSNVNIIFSFATFSENILNISLRVSK